MFFRDTCLKPECGRWLSSLFAASLLLVACFKLQLIQAGEGRKVSRNSGSPQNESVPRAFLDGKGEGWIDLGEKDFVNVNCSSDTWAWDGRLAHCTGSPVGILRSAKKYINFELMLEWCHLRAAGNSGVFVWILEKSIANLKPNQLPAGIEVQILDHGYKDNYEKTHNTQVDWFTTHGDVFPVGTATMKPFPPVSPNGERSFPSKNLSHGHGTWNNYYIRCINGEVRLWVNGEEVSGGTDCVPRSGYLALESEGSPIDFRNIRLRELP